MSISSNFVCKDCSERTLGPLARLRIGRLVCTECGTEYKQHSSPLVTLWAPLEGVFVAFALYMGVSKGAWWLLAVPFLILPSIGLFVALFGPVVARTPPQNKSNR